MNKQSKNHEIELEHLPDDDEIIKVVLKGSPIGSDIVLMTKRELRELHKKDEVKIYHLTGR